MAAVPARQAGVRELVLCSPPDANGFPARTVMAAAALARVDRIFALGGAGAIAAMAIGTETVPRVDLVVGPGNAYVAQAKLELASEVGIDCPAGPSELLVIWDAGAEPRFVAREMLAQAEHDPLAAVIAIGLPGTDRETLEHVLAELLERAPRREIAESALASRGAILSADTPSAIEFARDYAPEHLLLALAEPEVVFSQIRNAGTVYMGYTASVTFGDYLTGANHVLPTGGLARSYSGLSIGDFVRWTTYQRISRDAAARLAEDTALMADSEGLPGHAAAARAWEPQ
jgi:histidinol dehydrogenase